MEKLNTWLRAIIASIPNLVLAALILILAFFIARFLKKNTRNFASRFVENPAVSALLANIASTLFVVAMFFVALNIMNLDKALTALLGAAGVAGLVIGLALQDPLANLFSGIILSVRNLYRIGDYVETNNHQGTIEKINLRTTLLRTPLGEMVIMPNRLIVQAPLKNFTYLGRRNIEIKTGVAYGDDLDKVKSTAIEAVRNTFGADENEIDFFFTAFGESSIDFTIRCWVQTTPTLNVNMATSQAIMAIKKAFEQNSITIPYPVRSMDFGVVGGRTIDQIYPAKRILKDVKTDVKENGNQENDAG